MNVLVGLATAVWLGAAASYLYRGWRHDDPLFSGTTAYGVARAESREGDHLEGVTECESDDEVRCLCCGTANGRAFSFCRQCETPLC